MKYKILQADCIFRDQDIERDLLKKIDAELIVAGSSDKETLAGLAGDADGIIVTYAKIPESVIDAARKCRIIVKTGIGYDNIDVEAATARGIMVANVPDYCITEVADHTMALMLNCLRKVSYYHNTVKNGKWDMNLGRPIQRIGGLTLGLYGFGNIAREVASRAQAFGIDVVAYDPYIEDPVFEKANVKRIKDFMEFVSGVDILSLHAPLTSENRGIIDSTVLSKMKKTACLINTARGGLVNESDLQKAIDKKEIMGCGIDVMQTEPGDVNSPLLKYDMVCVTPHAAFYSEGSDVELRTKSVEQIILALTQGEPKYLVNPGYRP